MKVLVLLDRLLQWLVPSRSRQIAWSSTPDYSENAFHLYRYLVENHAGFTHCWLLDDESVGPRILEEYKKWGERVRPNAVRIIPRRSVRGYWTFLRSRYMFHTHGMYRLVRSARGRHVVSLWHGMPIKTIEALDEDSRATPAFGSMHIACSEPFRDVIAAAFRAPVDDVLLSALPRCDALSQPSELAPDRDHVIETLEVPHGQRLVLWMPTYRVSSTFRTHHPGRLGFNTFLDDVPQKLWAAIDDQARLHDCHVIVKLHPYDALAMTDFDPRKEWGLTNTELLRASEWAQLNLHLYDVLAVTDGLISDVSSVVIDWLTTRRPLGMVGCDPDTFVRKMVVDVESITSSARVNDLTVPGELEDFFLRVQEGRDAPPDPDLEALLYHSDLRNGCGTILAAVGL